jgi:hypothetical protein
MVERPAGRGKRPLVPKPDIRPADGLVVSLRDAPHAPIFFYEWAPTSGFANGIISVTLAANCTTHVRPNGEVVSESLVVAHLRGSVQAALNLRKALDRALSLAAGVQAAKGTTN